MTKQELIQYLNAASDAEAAVYFYESAIENLRRRKNTTSLVLERPGRIRPKHETPKKLFFSGKEIGHGISGVICVILFIISLFEKMEFGYRVLEVFVLGGIGFVLGFVFEGLGWIIYDLILEPTFDLQKTRRRNVEMDLACENEYNEKMHAYEKSCELDAKTKEEMDAGIRDLNQKCEEMKAQRSRLYDMNVLHVAFRNMIAVNQIRDYLEMGICNELEGTNGAYALYMQDVRANRICASIEELRKSVEKGFKNMVQTMAGVMAELMKTNSAIGDMSAAIESGISGLQRLIYDEQASANERYQASMREANGYLKNIQTTLSEAAHNEYIALKELNVSGYLHRM